MLKRTYFVFPLKYPLFPTLRSKDKILELVGEQVRVLIETTEKRGYAVLDITPFGQTHDGLVTSILIKALKVGKQRNLKPIVDAHQ